MLYEKTEQELRVLYEEWAGALAEGRVHGFGFGQLISKNSFLASDSNLKIDTFYDNNSALWGDRGEFHVLSPEKLDATHNKIIVFITSSFGAVHKQLQEAGFQPFHGYLNSYEFMLLHHWFAHKKVCCQNITIPSPLICNFRCRDCCMMAPHIAKPEHFTFREWASDLDRLMLFVDHLHYLSILGGEPFLFKQLPECIQYALDHYGSKIANVYLVTNGSFAPGPELIEVLRHPSITLSVTDYSQAGVSGYEQKLQNTLKVLHDNKIVPHAIVKVTNWTERYPLDPQEPGFTGEEVKAHYDRCLTNLRCGIGFSGGRFYPCLMSYAGAQRGWPSGSLEASLDLNALEPHVEGDRFKLVKAYLGYLESGPPALCSWCIGADPLFEGQAVIKGAIQMGKTA